MGDIAEAFRRARSEPGEDAGGDPKKPIPEIDSPGMADGEVPEAEPARLSTARDAEWPSRAVWVDKNGPVAEAFRHLAVRVRNELTARSTSSLLVVSCDPGEGKTVTACNLALALASLSAGERIALVEIDLRRPSLGRNLSVRPRVGFEDVLAGEAPLEACWTPTEIPALDLFPVRRPVANAHEVLARSALARTLHQLERSYSAVICDGPPALPVPDVRLIAPHVGICLPVVRAGETSRSAFSELMEMLPRTRMIGAFLNCARRPRRAQRYYEAEESGSPEESS